MILKFSECLCNICIASLAYIEWMQIFYFTLEDCNNEIETGCCFFQGRIEMVIRKKH
jgi:hypothetical protein